MAVHSDLCVSDNKSVSGMIHGSDIRDMEIFGDLWTLKKVRGVQQHYLVIYIHNNLFVKKKTTICKEPCICFLAKPANRRILSL